MFKWLLAERRLSRVLKLAPDALKSGWGPHEFYSAGQVDRVCSEYRFGPAERNLALALACEEAEFDRGVSGDADYQSLREAWSERLDLPDNWNMGHVFRRLKKFSSGGGSDEGGEG